MFRLVSLNLNGIRSAAAKGFEAWAEGVGADCMGVQEIKAQADIVTGRFDTVAGMKGHFHFAEKKGYSGVGLYSRRRAECGAARLRRSGVRRRGPLRRGTLRSSD